MKVLVTGGAGFIGSHLVDRLVSEKHEVIIVDDVSSGNLQRTSEVQKMYMVDCRDEELMDGIFKREKPEIVFHLAANAAEQKAQFSPVDITSRNYDAFIKTLTPFIKYGGKRFVFTSSIAVYGALQTPFKETDKPEPEDLYGITKFAAEQTLEVLSEIHDFQFVIARPHNVYGPRQNMRDPYRNVVTIWMNAILRGEPYYIYGDGEQKRCFSYIDDVVDALYGCGFEEVSGMTFNIGSDHEYTLNDLAVAINQNGYAYDRKLPQHLPERPQEVKVAVSDHKLLKKHLGYHETPLSIGISKTWEWCKSQGPQEPIYTELELPSEKAPKNWRKV